LFKARRRPLLVALIILILLALGQKVYTEIVFSAAKAASAVIIEVSNDNIIFDLNEDEFNEIQGLCESGNGYNLPHIKATRHVNIKGKDFLERVIFEKDKELNGWVPIRRLLGESDKNYQQRNINEHILVQDISLLSRCKDSESNMYVVVTEINFIEYHNKVVVNKYCGEIIFLLRKLGLSQWEVEGIETRPLMLIIQE
jgi:hypothetical protein